MSKLKKIEDRTIWFIESYNRLDKEGRLPTNVELAEIMGIPSKSTITNILKKEQNIQPDQWEKFKSHFAAQSPVAGSHKSEREPSTIEILAGLTEGFRAIAATMKSIESKMAQESTQTRIEDKVNKIEANLTETLTGVEWVSKMQLQEMLELLSQLRDQKHGHVSDSRKKSHGNGGDGHKSGIQP